MGQCEIQIMRKIAALKFDQNESIRDKLLATKGFLYEATKDMDFGCGLTLGQSKELNQKGIKKKTCLALFWPSTETKMLGLRCKLILNFTRS